MSKQLFFIYAALMLTFGYSVNSNAQEADKTLSPYFFIDSDNPGLDRLPLKSTETDISISGVIADVTVSQVYTNEGTRPIEAVYTFPASTRAAVNGMKMIIGNRVVEAQIKEKEKARKIYEQAKSDGKRASLLEQQRPNVFQMNVANIMPGDRVEVILEYTELLIPTDGIYEFVYPTVVGPRYSERSVTTASTRNDFVASPYTKSGIDPSYTFNLSAHLAAGIPLQAVECNTHQVDINYQDLKKAEIVLKPSERMGGNRDFILSYQLAGGQIQSGLMLYEGKDENFFTLMIQPPKNVVQHQIPPREYIFVVDVSGSMNGFPMDVSKTLLRNLLSNLQPKDRFNVILFAGTSYMMSTESMLCSPSNIQWAMRTLDGQRGGGSTRLLPALETSLRLPRCENGLSRSIVIVSDGYIDVERHAYDLISRNLDQANVFAFGIGSSVNRYLMEGLAHVGMGEPFIVTSRTDANSQAEKFREYIEKPVLTQITADFGTFEVYDVEPVSIPDVLAERPVVIYGKWKGKPKGSISVKGYSGGNDYVKTFNVEEVVPDPQNEGLKYVWAREKIKILGDYKIVDRYSDLEKQITDLGLKYSLLTEYTSFVAVDKIVINEDETLAKVDQPLPLAANVSNTAVGFDMEEIEGIVRRSSNVRKVSIGTIKGDLDEAEILMLKNAISNLLNTELSVSGKQFDVAQFDIHLSINEEGMITAFQLLNVKDEALEKYLKFLLAGWQIKELNPTNTIQLTIPVNLL